MSYGSIETAGLNTSKERMMTVILVICVEMWQHNPPQTFVNLEESFQGIGFLRNIYDF